MAKKATSKAKKPATKKKTTKKEAPLGWFGRVVLILFSVAGIFIMNYLTGLHNDTGGAACDISETLSCASVNVSEQSEILGIPVSLMGLAYFIGVLAVTLFAYNRKNLQRIGYISILVLGPSLYLTLTEAFVIQKWCIFCEYSKVLMLGIALVSISELGGVKKFGKDVLQSAIILALLFGGGTWLVQTMFNGDTVEDGTYTEFAQCLTDEGCVMFGSAKCQYCAKTREAFGDAFEYVTEIECLPTEEGNDAERCIEEQIEKTPTWAKEDVNGNIIDQLEPGYKSLEELSEWSGCPLPEET